MPRIVIPLILFICLCLPDFSSAQMLRRKKANPDEKPPKAVLVELFTAYKRLDRTQDSLTKPELMEALKKFNQKMIMDFEDNFKYCPVYYFYDSNIVAIQNGQIRDFLLDEKGKKVEDAVIEDGDTTIFLLYFGILVPDESTPFDAHVSKKMLVALDYKGDLLPFPLPRTPGPATYKNFKSKKLNVFYKYTNLRTNTYYRACAKRYSHALQDFYGRYPYNKKKKR
jgi:hypothetical protein